MGFQLQSAIKTGVAGTKHHVHCKLHSASRTNTLGTPAEIPSPWTDAKISGSPLANLLTSMAATV